MHETIQFLDSSVIIDHTHENMLLYMAYPMLHELAGMKMSVDSTGSLHSS